MRPDITKDTFDQTKHFNRVLQQQGRVTLDADFNEQAAIELHYLRTLARDIIGPYGTPNLDPGFMFATDANGVFTISAGRYYVNGILVENEMQCTYKNQPDYVAPDSDPLLQAVQKNDTSKQFGVYLDVWERHITAIEDDSIREKALGGPDTCTRTKVVWQVKALELTPLQLSKKSTIEKTNASNIDSLRTQQATLEKDFQAETDRNNQKKILISLQAVEDALAQLPRVFSLSLHETLLNTQDSVPPKLASISSASLAARVDPEQKTEGPCVMSPASKYRGTENQLYRVEIHQGTPSVLDREAGKTPTFKWSRDNGNISTAWLGLQGHDLQVATTRGFAAGNWVELSDDTSELRGQPGTLVRIVKIEGDVLSVDPAMSLPPLTNFPKNPKVRRWDYIATEALSLASDNAIPIKESTPDQIVWIALEDGVQIQFSANGEYHTGDYWLIPARVATGNVEWPLDGQSNPQLLPPHGIEHHYAILSFVSWQDQKLKFDDARFEFIPLLSPISMRDW